MKKVVHDIFWWPGITKSIEAIAAKCEGCKKYKKKPPPNSLSVWPFARRPMERVHVDFFEYRGKHVLLMVDAYSKKIWTALMNTDTTTNKTLAVLYGWFCSEIGTPTTLVSNNGPQFSAKEFGEKMSLWGIKHVFSPPYHPCSNSAAKREVQLCEDRRYKYYAARAATKVPIPCGQTHKNIHTARSDTNCRHAPRPNFQLVVQCPLPYRAVRRKLSARGQAKFSARC